MATPRRNDRDQGKIDEVRALDPADPAVSVNHGPCRLNAGEDAVLRRAKEEKAAEGRLLNEASRRQPRTR